MRAGRPVPPESVGNEPGGTVPPLPGVPPAPAPGAHGRVRTRAPAMRDRPLRTPRMWRVPHLSLRYVNEVRAVRATTRRLR